MAALGWNGTTPINIQFLLTRCTGAFSLRHSVHHGMTFLDLGSQMPTIPDFIVVQQTYLRDLRPTKPLTFEAYEVVCDTFSAGPRRRPHVTSDLRGRFNLNQIALSFQKANEAEWR